MKPNTMKRKKNAQTIIETDKKIKLKEKEEKKETLLVSAMAVATHHEKRCQSRRRGIKRVFSRSL